MLVGMLVFGAVVPQGCTVSLAKPCGGQQASRNACWLPNNLLYNLASIKNQDSLGGWNLKR